MCHNGTVSGVPDTDTTDASGSYTLNLPVGTYVATYDIQFNVLGVTCRFFRDPLNDPNVGVGHSFSSSGPGTDSTAVGSAAFATSLNTVLNCSRTGSFHANLGTVTFTKVDSLTTAAAQIFGE